MKSEIDLVHMKIFAVVGEMRTYTEAAAALNIPISKVSRAIKSIESVSRLQLVRRSEGAIHLTEAGSAYLMSCRRVLAAFQESAQLLNSHRSDVEGVLRVGVPPVFARYVLLPLLPDFKRRHPKLCVELVLYTSGWDRLPTADHDLLIKIKTPHESSRETRFHLKLFPPIRQGLFASPEYLTSHGHIEDLNALLKHQCIGYSSSAELNPWEGPYRGTQTQISPSFDFVVSDPEMQLSMAQSGLGVALLPLWLAHASVVANKLVRVVPDFEADPIPMNVLHSGRSRIAAKERAFLTFLDSIVATPRDPRMQGQPPSAFFLVNS